MSTCGGSDASLLDQHQDGRLALVDSLLMASRVRLSTIPSVEEALLNLGTFAFVSFHLFYAGGQNLSVIADLLRLIGIPEDLHTEVQGMSSSPHLANTSLQCVTAVEPVPKQVCICVVIRVLGRPRVLHPLLS